MKKFFKENLSMNVVHTTHRRMMRERKKRRMWQRIGVKNRERCIFSNASKIGTYE